MAVAGGTAQRRWLRALLWLAGLLLAMFAVSCLFGSSADAEEEPKRPDLVTHLLDPLLGEAGKAVHPKKNAPGAPIPPKPVTPLIKPVTELVEPVVHQISKPVTRPVAPLLDQTKKTLSQAGKPVADLVDATAPLLHLVEQPVANVLEPVKPVLDQVDHTVATVVQPVSGVVQTLEPVLDLVEDPLSLVTDSVGVVSRGLGQAVEPILVPLAEATETPLLPSLPAPKPPSATSTPPTAAKVPGTTTPAPQAVAATPVVTVVHQAPESITVTLPRGETPAEVPARTSAARPGTPTAPTPESPAHQGFPPVPFVPLSSPGNTTTATPHATSAGFAPEGVRLVLGYVVARQGDDVPLWRSIKPGSRPD
ncbi:hypothetical protein [Amycolatopsis sp. 195334CR]|uniref:hypothetical protein n=1 Tax=Amycolatopsis sp. 195334CR TaxID=2814588 RepID=UPI001A907D39|nr:hypothetical protein [Amycolatopsis sp. 195334CR]MBN6042046.1 hypothetical protein [Amycolatopsis sp. 195334CR]